MAEQSRAPGRESRNVYGWIAGMPGIKNPLDLCVVAEATIGMAGMLRGRLCMVEALCKKFGGLTQELSSVPGLRTLSAGEPARCQ